MQMTKNRAIVAATAAAVALATFSIEPAAAAPQKKSQAPQITKQNDEFSARKRYRSHRGYRGGGGAAALGAAGLVFGAIAGAAAADAYGYGPYPSYGYAPYPYYGAPYYYDGPRYYRPYRYGW